MTDQSESGDSTELNYPSEEKNWIKDIDQEFYREASYEFTDTEKAYLRPIAETLAMLDGNPLFFEDDIAPDFYEQYLHEASALFDQNGGLNGLAGMASFVPQELTEVYDEVDFDCIGWFKDQIIEVAVWSLLSISFAAAVSFVLWMIFATLHLL